MTPVRRFAFVGLMMVALAAWSCGGRSPRVSQFPSDGLVSAPTTSLFLTPERVVSHPDRVRVTGRLDPEREWLGPQAFVVAVGPGTLRPVFHQFWLRDEETGEAVPVADGGTLLRESNAGNAVTVESMGVMRRVRLAAVRINPETRITWQGRRYRAEGVDVEIQFPAWQPERVDDHAFTDRGHSFRQMIELSVANPEAIDLYAQARPATDARPAAWEPRPELSPGFGWLKIPITENGLYAIDGRWLAEAGRNAASVDPAQLVLLTGGEEVALLPVGPAGASFPTGARLLFYGLKHDSRETNERVYYLGVRPDGAARATFAASAMHDDSVPLLRDYVRRTTHREEKSLETRVGSFLSIREMNWVWERLEPGREVKIEFRNDGLPEPIPAATMEVVLYAAGRGLGGTPTLRVELNGRVLTEGAALSGASPRVRVNVPAGVLRRDRNEMTVTFQLQPGVSAPPIFLESIDVVAPSLFRAERGVHEIVLTDDQPTTGAARLMAVGFRANRLLAVDVSEPSRPRRLAVLEGMGASEVSAQLRSGAHILLVEDDMVDRAPAARASVWQDWRAHETGAETLVVYHRRFADATVQLVEQLRDAGHDPLAVDVESLYEAFSAGTLSTDALRDFAQHAVTHWPGRKPSTMILVGDATSDGQRITRNDVLNYVPTRILDSRRSFAGDEYCSDSWYSWLVGADELADLFVGRLSVASEDDAAEVVRKTGVYRHQKPEPWTGRLLTIADYGEFHDVATRLRSASLPSWFDDVSLHTAEYPWEDNFYLPREVLSGEESKVSPLVTAAIEREINAGTLLVTFLGHGSPNIWSNQRIWFGGDSENSDNLRLANAHRLPFLTTFTCNNGAIDYPIPRWHVNIVEDMMRVPDGGFIGAFAPSGPGFSRNHMRLAEGFYDAMGALGVRELRMLAEMSRLKYQGVIGSDDHSRMYLLLGDPTLKLPVLEPGLNVSVEPGVLADRDAAQSLRVRVTGVDRLTSGTAILRGQYGRAMASVTLRPADDGSLTGTLSAAIPRREADLRLLVQATDARGRMLQSGERLFRAPADVRITAFLPEAESGEAGVVRASYVVHNASLFATEGTLTVHLMLSETDRDVVAEIPYRLAPLEKLALPIEMRGPAGAWVLQARVSPTIPEATTVNLPSAWTWDAIIIPGERAAGADMALPPGAFRLLPSRARATAPQVETFIANLGDTESPSTLHWTVRYPDGSTQTGSRTTPRIAPGTFHRLAVPIRMEMRMTTAFEVELASEPSGDEMTDPNPDNNRLVHTLTPDHVPDLALVAGSLRAWPDPLTEGVTLFVEGIVENRGRETSLPTAAQLFAADDVEFRSPLRAIPGQLYNRIPALEPGMRWPIRLRWDPVDNAGVGEIVLVLDPDDTLMELDKDNNIVRVPLSVRSKWRLTASGMSLRPGGPGTVVLVAHLGNEGETDARNVSVWFYADEDQTTENYLGEVLIERLPAGTQMAVPFVWNLEGVDLHALRNPTFSIALKGSLQRVSSSAGN